MKITRTKYAIITENRPTEFLTYTGELSSHFDDAHLYDQESWAVETLDTLDEPGKFIILPVTVTAEV